MKIFVAGACGFIAGNIIHRLLRTTFSCEIVAFDNLSSGKLWYLDDIKDDPRLHIVIGDIKSKELLIDAMKGVDIVYHFASNADISKAESDPTIDFYEGTLLTQNIIEAARINNVKRIVYASGSGIYGDNGSTFVDEDHGPLLPTSTYGASKIAGEALICSYAHMFGIIGRSYRFANVVGGRQTHGVGLSFVEKLINDPKYLLILGSGNQSKSYIYVDDILDGIAQTKGGVKVYNYFNLCTEDFITVKEIADIVCDEMKLKNVKYEFTGGERGWRGDIAVVRFVSNKARFYGWKPRYTAREAMRKSIKEILELKGYFN